MRRPSFAAAGIVGAVLLAHVRAAAADPAPRPLTLAASLDPSAPEFTPFRYYAEPVQVWSWQRRYYDGDDDKDRKAGAKKASTHFTAVPMAGGDSDIGIGGGALAALSRDVPGRDPFLYRMEGAGFVAVRFPGSGLSANITYQDYYLLVTLPHLIPGKLRLEIRPSFTEERRQKYFGIGNAAGPAWYGVDPETNLDFYTYGRVHPRMLVNARLTLSEDLYLQWGMAYTHNWLDVQPGTSLAYDFENGSDQVKALLGGQEEHGVANFDYAFVVDTRNSELSATKGVYHQVKVRLSPGGSKWMPYDYVETNLTLRFYKTIVPKYLVVAVRGVGDIMFGHPPFYELARADDQFALGGANGVRGVPAQQYYGKTKIFGSVELRSEIVEFDFLGEKTAVGLAAFVDAGRVWAESDFSSGGVLDEGGGLKYGVGGGLRFRQGENFLIRGDVAWSPDARPIGGYFAAGQAF